MREALYLVKFGDVADPRSPYRNGGVAVLETNRVFGGDSGYYYLGRYTIKDDRIAATVDIIRHDANWSNAFGDLAVKFTVEITGKAQGQNFVGTMTRADTGMRLPIALIWAAALPG